ncbi:unnamed protein product [Arabidopsis thaliana]|uniref:F-box domain-containing protein n=1 Tax=Arabidopsis thaliana TaxID=3702 RepID=A0A654FGV8_ARATH|nr:unnamed protein product [Arabidopsis thaliana]
MSRSELPKIGITLPAATQLHRCFPRKHSQVTENDAVIPSDLLQEILSRLELRANIQASAVCKSWCEAAASIRKLQPRPWLLYPLKRSSRGFTDPDTPCETYILFDPLRNQSYKQEFPGLGCHKFLSYKDGWLLVSKYDYPGALFFLNPFTRERFYLPLLVPCCGAFSAAPTSTSCLVACVNYYFEIMTWRLGETVWTTHCFGNHIRGRKWDKCVFSNGMFFCLSTCGYLRVFDPHRATWNILPVKPCILPLEPCLAFRQPSLMGMRVLMMEHEGDVYVISTFSNYNNQASVFKLNLKREVWEEKKELGGLTVFAGYHTSLTRASLLALDRNKMYTSHAARSFVYYSLAGNKFSRCPPGCNYLSDRFAWVDPPHNQRSLIKGMSFIFTVLKLYPDRPVPTTTRQGQITSSTVIVAESTRVTLGLRLCNIASM